MNSAKCSGGGGCVGGLSSGGGGGGGVGGLSGGNGVTEDIGEFLEAVDELPDIEGEVKTLNESKRLQ